MADFDAFDQEAAVAVSDILAETVILHPMTEPARAYTRGSTTPDPSRPIKTIQAIVTWRPSVIGPGATDPTSGTQRGALESFDVAVDIMDSDFPDWLPRDGDIFEFMPPFYMDNQYAAVARELTDTTARTIFYCLGVSADDINL